MSSYYDLKIYEAVLYTGPLEILTVLVMVACFLLAAFRTFKPTGNTILAALPLTLGVMQTLRLMNQLVPAVDKAVRRIPDLDLDSVIFSTLLDIRMFLIFGLLFSSLTVLAILLRHRRKSPANSIL